MIPSPLRLRIYYIIFLLVSSLLPFVAQAVTVAPAAVTGSPLSLAFAVPM